MGAKVNPVSYVEQWKIDKAKRKAAEQAEKQKAAEQNDYNEIKSLLA